jgi:3-deoxy-manno-octulosonate cytidylyltransferase (CMP-KDO synthetase)
MIPPTEAAQPGVAIVIPARYGSTRYPGKPLAELRGASGRSKPLIQRSWEAAKGVAGSHSIHVATDDDRIARAASAFGAEVALTPENCANGTERCAATLPQLDPATDIVVNFQGDALLTPPWFVEALVDHLITHPEAQVATPALRCSAEVHRRLLADQREGRVGGTTVVRSSGGNALYFSKSVIPHVPDTLPADAPCPVFLHIGIYAYRRAALEQYCRVPICELELLEGLEQLRFLDAGIPVSLVEVDARGRDIWELNNASDIPPIESALAALGID